VHKGGWYPVQKIQVDNTELDVIKICNFMSKKILIVDNIVVFLKSKISCGTLYNITSDFGVVMQVNLGKAIISVVTRDIISRMETTRKLCKRSFSKE
jgi:hypothetical protein